MPPGTGHRDAQRIAYCIARDSYKGREDVGLVVQMAVAPEHRRSLVAAEVAEAERAKANDVEAKKQAKLEAKRAAKAAVKKLNAQNDPRLKAMARELRDRWMEAVQRDPTVLSLPSDGSGRAYDAVRALEAPSPSPCLREGSERLVRVKRVENVRRLAG